MRYIIEREDSLGTYYEETIDNIFIKKIRVTRMKRERNDFVFFMLFDSTGNLIEDAFKYINLERETDELNSREKIVNALKLLFCFKEIRHLEFSDFKRTDVKLLSNFILGFSNEGKTEKYKYVTTRSASTHDGYFVIIRQFLDFTHVTNKYFKEEKASFIIRGGFGRLSHTRKLVVMKFKTTKSKSWNKSTPVPKFISPKEYNSIIEYLEKEKYKFSLRNTIIAELMFTTGMRLGEVLGTTLEDITASIENTDYGILKIRNRMSDKKYQKAKTTMKVRSIDDYNHETYKSIDDGGYQVITLVPELYIRIKQYISVSRSVLEISEKVQSNRILLAKADSVEGYINNSYLFLNKNGAPLSSSGWNTILKDAFIANGISIDGDFKKDNLSHRFRHGYAMYLFEVLKKPIQDVMDDMRHRSIQSTMIYYNLTQEQKRRKALELENSMREKRKEYQNWKMNQSDKTLKED